MNGLIKQEVFSIGAETYCWRDVVSAAKLWGDWVDLERETRTGVACLKLMKVEGDPLSPNRVAKLETEFRYAHDLITAQETEGWLKRWGLAVDEWRLYFRRSLLKQHWAERLPEIIAGYPVTDDDDIEQSIKSEAICSGTLARLAHKLAGRAAVYERAFQESGSDRQESGRVPHCPVVPQESRRQACLRSNEAAFEQFCAEVITKNAVRDRIAMHRIDWTRLTCLEVSFPEEQLAREAALCVREDGMELSEVAADAKTSIEQRSFFLDHAEASLTSDLLAASKGELLGPFHKPHLARYVLLFVLAKQIPSEADPSIRERAEESLLKSAIDHEINNRVRWLARL